MYGFDDWTFDAEGKMRKRMMSCKDVVIERVEWFVREVEEGGNVNDLVNRVEIGEDHW